MRIKRWVMRQAMLAVLGVCIAACSSEERLYSGMVSDGVGYDVHLVEGPGWNHYEAKAVVDPKKTKDLAQIRLNLTYLGLAKAKQDGYDLVIIDDSRAIRLNVAQKIYVRGALAPLVSTDRDYPGIAITLDVYKSSAGERPPAAKAIDGMLQELKPKVK